MRQSYADGKSNSHGYTDSYAHGNGNGHRNCDRIAAVYTDAATSADTATSTVRLIGCS